MRPDSDGVSYNHRFRSNHFAEFWSWSEYQQDGERQSVAHFKSYPPSLCMALSASLSDSLNANVTKVTIIYLLSAWATNHKPPTHTQTHLFTSTSSVTDTSKTLVLFSFFFLFLAFTSSLTYFYVPACLLLFCLHRLSICLLNNFF